jgi:hypothetical protein
MAGRAEVRLRGWRSHADEEVRVVADALERGGDARAELCGLHDTVECAARGERAQLRGTLLGDLG